MPASSNTLFGVFGCIDKRLQNRIRFPVISPRSAGSSTKPPSHFRMNGFSFLTSAIFLSLLKMLLNFVCSYIYSFIAVAGCAITLRDAFPLLWLCEFVPVRLQVCIRAAASLQPGGCGGRAMTVRPRCRRCRLRWDWRVARVLLRLP